MKNVQFDEYFADKKMLLLSVKSQMSIRGEGGFSEQEVYRLKKIVLRLKQELNNVEDTICRTVGLLFSSHFCASPHIKDNEFF
jgi:hypothetical protein